MQYLGGKSRLARKIVSVLRERAPETVGVVEPFCGGGAVTEHLCAWRPTLASDLFPGLVDLLIAVKQGFRLPVDGVTPYEYQQLKRLALSGSTSPKVISAGFALSYSGKWFGGHAKVTHNDKADYAVYFNNWADRWSKLDQLWLQTADYRSYDFAAQQGTTFYLDPPYRGTEGYTTGTFNHHEFDAKCLQWRQAGARVFVSEFSSPFTEVWCNHRRVCVNNAIKHDKTCVDRLYEVLP
jgi:DNA adenine methylase